MPTTTYNAFSGSIIENAPGGTLGPVSGYQPSTHTYGITDDLVIPFNAIIVTVIVDVTQKSGTPGSIWGAFNWAFQGLLSGGGAWSGSIPPVSGGQTTGTGSPAVLGVTIADTSGHNPATSAPWTRANVFASSYGFQSTWYNSNTLFPASTSTNEVTRIDVVVSWVAGAILVPPPQTPVIIPDPPHPCPCPSVSNPCPCLPGPAGPPGTGLPGTPGNPGGPGRNGTNGTNSSNPGPPGPGPIGGGGGGGSGWNPGGVGWNAAICTNTGGAPMAYATVLPSEVFLPGQESQFWFEIAQPS